MVELIDYIVSLLEKHGIYAIPLLLWFLWAWYNWRVLKIFDHNDKPDESIQSKLSMLQEDRLGQFYRRILGIMLDGLNKALGDGGQAKHNFISRRIGHWLEFDHNPWTEPSFSFSLRLALLYPILAFVLFWLMGGSNTLEGVRLLPKLEDVSHASPWLIGLGIVSALLVLYLLIQWFKRIAFVWFVLFIAEYSLMLGIFYEGWTFDAIVIALVIFILTALLSAPAVFGCWLASWLFVRKSKLAWQQAWPMNKETIIAVAVVVVVSFTVTSSIDRAFVVAAAIGFAIGFAIAFDGVFVVAFASAFALAFGGSVTLALALAGTGANFFFVSLTFAGTAAGAGAIAVLYQHMRSRNFTSFFWLVYWLLGISLVAAYFAGFDLGTKILFLFWLILPLINAPLDWLSLGITRGLLQSLRSGEHSGLRGFLWALADVGLALGFFFLMSAVLFVTVGFFNWVGGESVLNLSELLHKIQNTPADPDLYWVYFMLFSTLLPTLLHFAIAGASVTLWFPEKWRHSVVDAWQNNANKKLGIWFYVSVMPVAGFVLAPGVLLAILWWLLSNHGAGLGWLLASFYLLFL